MTADLIQLSSLAKVAPMRRPRGELFCHAPKVKVVAHLKSILAYLVLFEMVAAAQTDGPSIRGF